jgi:hypothetical protein
LRAGFARSLVVILLVELDLAPAGGRRLGGRRGLAASAAPTASSTYFAFGPPPGLSSNAPMYTTFRSLFSTKHSGVNIAP